MVLRIIEDGLHTTIQDKGRLGFQADGLPVSGAMDQQAMALANIIAGNERSEAVIEMSFIGASIQFERAANIALAGADMGAKINEKPIPIGKAIAVKPHDILQLRTARKGSYCYLAVHGGFILPEAFGSRSTTTSFEIGGHQGRRLKRGDVIAFREHQVNKTASWYLNPDYFSYIPRDDCEIRFTKGQQAASFHPEEYAAFTGSDYRLSTKSNRMGFRFEGAPLSVPDHQLLTEAAAFGTIQIPPNGKPIVLMADRQPTGGYPKIGQVIQADLPKLSQLRPGKRMTFTEVSLEAARKSLVTAEEALQAAAFAVNLKRKDR